MKESMLLDLILGITSLLIGLLLVAYNPRLATLMREGDDGWRERGWTGTYEPNVAFLESDRGRWWIFRSWLLLSATGFVVIGAGLLLRVAL
jgi:hypothetical protein